MSDLQSFISQNYRTILAALMVLITTIASWKSVESAPRARIISGHKELEATLGSFASALWRCVVLVLWLVFSIFILPASDRVFTVSKCANALLTIFGIAGVVIGVSAWSVGIAVYAVSHPSLFLDDYSKLGEAQRNTLYFLMGIFLRKSHPFAKLPAPLCFRSVVSVVFAPRAPANVTFSDIRNPIALATKLAQSSDAVSHYLNGRLSAELQRLLRAATHSPSCGVEVLLTQSIADEFDKIIRGESIYDPHRFGSVTLSGSTRSLLSQSPKGEALLRLNRLLIEDAYPDEITPDLWVREPNVQKDERITSVVDQVNDAVFPMIASIAIGVLITGVVAVLLIAHYGR